MSKDFVIVPLHSSNRTGALVSGQYRTWSNLEEALVT